MSKYLKILSTFPKNINFAFAYGSAVKAQSQTTKETNDKMIDLIFVVENARKFHSINLEMNRNHYSCLKFLGPDCLVRIQEQFAANVYYNTLANFNSQTKIKYGVISMDAFINDLLDWCHLYIAGRLHKPVEIIRPSINNKLRNALNLNETSAVHAALLILPEVFSEYQLYYTICNLSYSGDFRMIFGENPNKIQNILKFQLSEFRSKYRPILKTLNKYVDFELSFEQINKYDIDLKKNQSVSEESEKLDFMEYSLKNCNYIQNKDVTSNLYHLTQLPRCPQRSLIRLWKRNTNQQDTEESLLGVAHHSDCSTMVKQCISEIVWRSSWTQSFKGLFTAGFKKSFQYSFRKIFKMYSTS